MRETPDNEAIPDARLAAIYRAAAGDMPPPELDAAILAAARREVGARPRRVGYSFVRSWRGALSVAAVVVLSVSLVTLMREEAPELLSPAGEEAVLADSKPKSSIGENKNDAVGDSRRAREAEAPKSLGLKPSHSMPSSGLVPPHADFNEQRPLTLKDRLASGPMPEKSGPLPSAKRRDGLAETVDPRSNRSAEFKAQRAESGAGSQKGFAQAPIAPEPAESMAEKPASAGKMVDKNTVAKTAPADANRELDAAESAKTRDAQSTQRASPGADWRAPSAAPRQVAPAAPMAANKLERNVDTTPEKWLERIEELRKQGRLDEARASLREFSNRYPDYRLPESLRNGIQ